jgi:multiple sugar transport system substrate-binding protein
MSKSTYKLLVLVLLVGGLVAGCAPAATPTPVPPAPAATAVPAPTATPEPEEVTITFAAVATGGSDLELRDKWIADFAAAHPNITVKREELPHADFWVKIPAEIAAGAGPDVIMLPYLEQAVTFAAKGMLEPLDSFIDGPNGLDRDDWLPEVVKYGVYGGDTLVLPMSIMVHGLAYNKDMFDAAGVDYPTDNWTWDDMLAAATKLTLDANGNNAGDSAFDPEAIKQWGMYTWWWNSDFAHYLWTFGGDWMNQDASKCTLDSPEAIQAITFYGDLTQKYHVAPYLRELGPAHGYTAFMEKQVAMTLAGSVAIPDLEASDVNWDMARIPYQAGKTTRANFMFGDGVAMLKGSENPEEAWEFTKFWAGQQHTRALAEAGIGFAPWKSVMDKVEFPPKQKICQEMLEEGWTLAIRATDYGEIVISPCNTIMEGVLAKGAQPDYAALAKTANDECNLALQEAPPMP